MYCAWPTNLIIGITEVFKYWLKWGNCIVGFLGWLNAFIACANFFSASIFDKLASKIAHPFHCLYHNLFNTDHFRLFFFAWLKLLHCWWTSQIYFKWVSQFLLINDLILPCSLSKLKCQRNRSIAWHFTLSVFFHPTITMGGCFG